MTKEKPKMRELVIITDGANVEIKKTEVTLLEIREIGRLLASIQQKEGENGKK